MSEHKHFSYKTSDELRAHAQSLGLHLPWSDDFSHFSKPINVGDKKLLNRFVILPVEGRDANRDGTPSDITRRRYRRYAEGGSGMIHFEAIATCNEARASGGQLLLTEDTAQSIESLLNETRKVGFFGNPVCYIQVQESGRYAHATGAKELTAENAGDEELERVIDRFVKTAELSYKIGFDGVDVKSCHRYLFSELLGAHTRGGKFGGSFENRVRVVLDSIDRIRTAVPDKNFQIVSRLNIYDAIPHPFGWGMDTDGSMTPDMTEPLRLIQEMERRGIAFISTTCGTPYGLAWVNRPFDRHIPGAKTAPEHPLEGVCRGIHLTATAQKKFPTLPMSGFGLSWLRQYLPNVAAGTLEEGGASLAGLGRMGLAYPEVARDILEGKLFDKSKTCVTCSYCSEKMSKGGIAGCYIRDKAFWPTGKMMLPV